MLPMAEIGFSNAALRQMISDAYNEGEKYQWMREAYINAIEAGATDIEFGIEHSGLIQAGVRRRTILDNGHGMEPHELVSFMSTYGGSGKRIGDDGNRGIGFKSSTFQWNPYGILIASWTEGNPDGSMVWLYLDEDTDRWRITEWEFSDGSISTVSPVAPLEIGEAVIDVAGMRTEAMLSDGHGTAILLLGTDENADTDSGDPERGEKSSKVMAGYLNSRFLTIPEGVTVRVFETAAVNDPERDNNAKVITLADGREMYIWPRTVQGRRHYIAQAAKTAESRAASGQLVPGKGVPAAARGVVKVASPWGGPSIAVEWFFVAEEVKQSNRQYGAPPSVAYRYDQRLHGGRVISEVYANYTSATHFRNYGLSSPAARGKFWLIVHFPEWTSKDPGRWGVVSNAARSALYGKGGVPTFAELVDHTAEKFWEQATEVRKILAALQPPVDTSAKREDRVKRLTERIGERLRHFAKLVVGDGTERGTRNGGNVGGKPRGGGRTRKPGTGGSPTPPPGGTGWDGSVETLTPDETGDETGRTERRAFGFPEVKWLAGEDFATQFDSDVWTKRAAVWMPKEEEVWVNRDFALFEAQRAHWQAKYPKATPEDVQRILEEKYSDLLCSVVAHIRGLNGHAMTPGGQKFTGGPGGDTEQMLDSLALTTALLGYYNVEAQIATQFGGELGKAA